MDYKMEYKTVIHPYDFAFLVDDAKGKMGSEAAYETVDWNNALNKYGKDDWTVKKIGTLVSGKDLVFWALLEREVKKEGF